MRDEVVVARDRGVTHESAPPMAADLLGEVVDEDLGRGADETGCVVVAHEKTISFDPGAGQARGVEGYGRFRGAVTRLILRLA